MGEQRVVMAELEQPPVQHNPESPDGGGAHRLARRQRVIEFLLTAVARPAMGFELALFLPQPLPVCRQRLVRVNQRGAQPAKFQ